MDVKEKVIYFDNDQEFYEYVVVPRLVPIQYVDNCGNERYYTDFNFSPQYLHNVENGTKFIIKDEDSQIYKHGAVSYRTITKEISNLEPWYDDED